ncbi:hypothetical protein [Janthinobacterium sp. DSP2-3-3]|uniref:hypothetical protein n=1 Tax=Janthinobacterium sp. DSP2-3-3 TaxID=2804596 RepID=UPI003CEBCF37
MAIAACRARGDDVHPVHVRNIGFYHTWQRCAAQREDGAAQLSAADVLARLHLRFAENDDLVRNILLRHSPRNFSRDAIECDAMFTTAALMFWQRPNVVIELTPASERLLTSSDLGEDIPAAQLRPRMAACYIRFGEAMRQAVVLPAETGVHSIQGAYVFASTYKGKRAISIVAIYAAGRDEPLGISSLDFVIEGEQESLLSVIRRQCGGDATVRFLAGAANGPGTALHEGFSVLGHRTGTACKPDAAWRRVAALAGHGPQKGRQAAPADGTPL